MAGLLKPSNDTFLSANENLNDDEDDDFSDAVEELSDSGTATTTTAAATDDVFNDATTTKMTSPTTVTTTTTTTPITTSKTDDSKMTTTRTTTTTTATTTKQPTTTTTTTKMTSSPTTTTTTTTATTKLTPLEMNLKDTQRGFHLFLNNQFEEAQELFEKLAGKSMYHALGKAAMTTFQAAMTFQSADIEHALKTIKVTLHVCESSRRKGSFLDSIHKSRHVYDAMSAEEAHAELCYAELLLQQAFLTFIQDENFVSFIKGAFKVKTCLNSYKESVEIMKKRSWKENEGLEDFRTGICMGVGAFNLMISLLPPRILKVLEFVGYRGSKEKGLRELETGAMLSDTLRSPICSVLLIQYHIIISYIFGLGDGDTELSSRLLDTMQAKCPNSAIFHFLRGRIYEVSGDIDRAIMTFEESIDSQDQWKQLHHFCCWELMWCHSYLGNWLLAMKYAEKLFEESKWSKSMYAYLKGTFMMMMMMKTTTTMMMVKEKKKKSAGSTDSDRASAATAAAAAATTADDGDVGSEKMRKHINTMFNEVPRLKQRIAGKSVPVEKWAVTKVQMYYEQSEFLMLPAYEVMYVWNGFEVMGKREELMVSVISVIEEALRNLTMTSEDEAPNIMKFDNACLLNLLLGVCFRLIGQFDSAEKCFAFVLDNKKNVQRDTYLVPSCMYERGLLFMQMLKFKEAEKSFDDARSFPTGYHMESRILSKIQAGILKVKNILSKDTPANDTAVAAAAVASPAVLDQDSTELFGIRRKESVDCDDDDVSAGGVSNVSNNSSSSSSGGGCGVAAVATTAATIAAVTKNK